MRIRRRKTDGATKTLHRLFTTFEVKPGIRWCLEHEGIVDETADWNEQCDNAWRDQRDHEMVTACRTVPLYVWTADTPEVVVPDAADPWSDQ